MPAAYDIYLEQLSELGQGTPLYYPEPGASGGSLEIGDVGYLHEGAFVRLFNVTRSADDPRQRFGVPEGFQLLDMGLIQTIEAALEPGPLQSKSVSIIEATMGIPRYAPGSVIAEGLALMMSYTSTVLPLDASFHFKCTSNRGAILMQETQMSIEKNVQSSPFVPCASAGISVTASGQQVGPIRKRRSSQRATVNGPQPTKDQTVFFKAAHLGSRKAYKKSLVSVFMQVWKKKDRIAGSGMEMQQPGVDRRNANALYGSSSSSGEHDDSLDIVTLSALPDFHPAIPLLALEMENTMADCVIVYDDAWCHPSPETSQVIQDYSQFHFEDCKTLMTIVLDDQHALASGSTLGQLELHPSASDLFDRQGSLMRSEITNQVSASPSQSSSAQSPESSPASPDAAGASSKVSAHEDAYSSSVSHQQFHDLLTHLPPSGTAEDRSSQFRYPYTRRIPINMVGNEIGNLRSVARGKNTVASHRRSTEPPKQLALLRKTEESQDQRHSEEFKATLENEEEYTKMLGLEGVHAQEVLDMFQLVLDSPMRIVFDEDMLSFRKNLIVATQGLAAASGLYPHSYELSSITIPELPQRTASFANIYKGDFSGLPLYIKTIRVSDSMFDNTDDVMKIISKEAILWRQLQHLNLLPFYGIYLYQGRFSFVAPWMNNGVIGEYLKIHTADNRVVLAHDVAQGLKFLHANGIIHGDLKGENILVNDLGRACIADFERSSIPDKDILAWIAVSSEAQTGSSFRYKAPELFGKNGKPQTNTTASDMYAWACVAYEIFAGEVPFAHLIPILAIGRKPTRPPAASSSWKVWGLTEDIWTLMEACWDGRPTVRPPVEAVANFLAISLPTDIQKKASDHPLSPAQFREMVRGGLEDHQNEISVEKFHRLIEGK
ncbi:hypothetical protein H0H92_000783 [Tricholoma furcatifolium]|nr:hypothetical protein H0H92_000783 [Tricholoma furcatifolium]